MNSSEPVADRAALDDSFASPTEEEWRLKRAALQSAAFDSARRSVDDLCRRVPALMYILTEDDLDELEADFGDAILAAISRGLDGGEAVHSQTVDDATRRAKPEAKG